MTLHGEDARHVVQLLGHVLSDALELAAATWRAACRGRGFVVYLASRQMGRQRCAFGLLLLAGRLDRTQLFDLVLNGGQIAVEFLFQQVALIGAVTFGLGGELQPLEKRALVGELLVEGALVTQFREQALGDFAQLLCVQFAQGLLVDHHDPQCANHQQPRPLAHLPIAMNPSSNRSFRSR